MTFGFEVYKNNETLKKMGE